jgi:hypothetical protein
MRKYTLLKDIVFWLLLIVPGVIFTYTLWHIIYPDTPMVLYSITVTNPGKVVKAGDRMTYLVDFDKKLRGTCRVKRQLVNSYLIDYDVEEPPEKEMGRNEAKGKLHVPRGADPGLWYMRWTAECPTGIPGQVVPTSGKSDTFEVIK